VVVFCETKAACKAEAQRLLKLLHIPEASPSSGDGFTRAECASRLRMISAAGDKHSGVLADLVEAGVAYDHAGD
jgi:hypothetical protein